MKAILFSLFVVLLMIGCAGGAKIKESKAQAKHIGLSDYTIILNALEDEFLFHQAESQSHTGWVKIMHEHGQVCTLAQFIEGKLDGQWNVWHENGQKEFERTFKGGKEEGIQTFWYKNGQKRSEINYKDDNRHGSYSYWHENGQKASELSYNCGKLHGIYMEWHENGQKKVDRNYKEGKAVGLVTFWYKNGQKERDGKFKDGKLNGVANFWYENGQKSGECNYKEEKLMSAEVWKPNGEKCPVTSLKDGNGVAVMYKDDGTEKSRRAYKNGEEVYLSDQLDRAIKDIDAMLDELEED